MIKDNTILSCFDERPTLLEWLKKVENEQNESVKQVAIENGNLVVTFVSGKTEIVGPVGGDNPYADIILINRDTNTTKIASNVEVGGKLQVNGEAQVTGNVAMGGNLGVTGQAVIGGGGSINGALGVTGNATIGGTITAGGKAIKAVEANPTGEATQTLEKVKIGDVAYKVGGSENDKELTLILPYPKTSNVSSKYVTIEDENVWGKLLNYYYETIKIYYNDGYPLGIFSVIDYYSGRGSFNKGYRAIVPKVKGSDSSDWYGRKTDYYYAIKLDLRSSDGVNKVGYYEIDDFYTYSLDKSKFDALYKLADKPTQDGTYVLKASVSGGAVTYTWELQQ